MSEQDKTEVVIAAGFNGQLGENHRLVTQRVVNENIIDQSATMADVEAAFRAGFKAGFGVTREGFNGECAFDNCAPGPFDRLGDPDTYNDEAVKAAEDAAFKAAYPDETNR